MGLFLIVAAPLWYLLIVSFYKTPSRAWRAVFLPWLGGLLIGMGSLLITLSFLSRVPFSMDLGELYKWAWLRGPGWGMLPAIVAVILIYLFKPTSYSRIRQCAGWLSGAATIYMIWGALVLDPGFEAYRVLLSPFVWLAALGTVGFLTDRGLRMDAWPRYLVFAAAVILPLLFTFIPVLYNFGERLIAWILAVFFAAAGTMLAFLDSRGRF